MRRARNQRVRAAAARARETADRTAGGREDHVRVTGLDLDRADGPVVEGLHGDGLPGPHAGPAVCRTARPALAAVRRLVDADAGLAAAAAGVRLARAGPDRVGVAGRSGRARATRCCCARTPPTGTSTAGCCASAFVGPPDAAVRVGDPEAAAAAVVVVVIVVAAATAAAVRIDHGVRDPAAEVRRAGVVDGAVAVRVRQALAPRSGRAASTRVPLPQSRAAAELCPVARSSPRSPRTGSCRPEWRASSTRRRQRCGRPPGTGLAAGRRERLDRRELLRRAPARPLRFTGTGAALAPVPAGLPPDRRRREREQSTATTSSAQSSLRQVSSPFPRSRCVPHRTSCDSDRML